jgi:hypothetical protein
MSRLPEHMTMSPDQADQERMFDFRLTHQEAQRRIDELKREIALADSF